MLTVLSVVGTRPEAIKMAPVIHELERHPQQIRSAVCSTGQHREMLDPVFELFDIRPDAALKVMVPEQGLSDLTARLIESLDPVIRDLEPDWVLAQGDTTTVLAAALVAHYNGARFGHVEAGLRTNDRNHPFPEEGNRRMTDAITDLFFAPTAWSREALLREGHPDEHIIVTGNTVIDALQTAVKMPYDWSIGPLADLPSDARVVLVTAHRRESIGEPFRKFFCAIRNVAERLASENILFVYPVHLNPKVSLPAREILGTVENVMLIPPLDYLSMVHLMERSEVVLTDSGGIQEEAASLGVPVLIAREKTERPEGVHAGVAKLVGTSGQFVDELITLLRDRQRYQEMSRAVSPYGDGKASPRIAHALMAYSNSAASPDLL